MHYCNSNEYLKLGLLELLKRYELWSMNNGVAYWTTYILHATSERGLMTFSH